MLIGIHGIRGTSAIDTRFFELISKAVGQIDVRSALRNREPLGEIAYASCHAIALANTPWPKDLSSTTDLSFRIATLPLERPSNEESLSSQKP